MMAGSAVTDSRASSGQRSFGITPLPPSARRNRTSAARRSNGSRARGAAPRPRARRRRAAALSAAADRAHRAHLRHIAVAVEHDIAARGQRAPRRARRSRRASAAIERSSVSRSTPSKPMLERITSPISRADKVAGSRGIERGIDDMGGHRQRHVGKRAERREIVRLELGAAAHRRAAARDGCRAWRGRGPGMCFTTGSTPPASSPSQAARPSAATAPGRVAIGAVADDRVGARRREDRAPAGNRR